MKNMSKILIMMFVLVTSLSESVFAKALPMPDSIVPRKPTIVHGYSHSKEIASPSRAGRLAAKVLREGV